MRLLFITCCAAIISFTNIVHGDTAISSDPVKTPVGALVSDMRFAMLMCEMQAATASLQGKLDYSCRDEYLKSIKPVYAAAADSLAKNKPALGMLKDLYAYWITTITTINPSASELRVQYQARTKEREAGVNERINRLLLEINEM